MASWTPADRRDYCFTTSQGQKLLTVTAWGVETGIPLRNYSCDSVLSSGVGSRSPAALCLLGESHLICTPNNLPFIYVWNLNKEQVMLKIACVGMVRALSCSPDGIYCAGAIGEKVYIWHICTGNLIAVVSQHYRPINVIQFSDDRVHFITGGEDSRVIVWKLNSVLAEAYTSSGCAFIQTPIPSSPPSLTRHIWSDHSLPITDLHCGKGGLHCRVVTVSLDQTCKIYEIASGNLLCSILFDFGLTSVTLDLAEQWLFVGASNGKIFQVNLFSKPMGSKIADEEMKWQYTGHTKAISGLAVTNWSHLLVSTSELEDTARVWDIASHQTLKEVKLKGPVSKMLLSGGSLLPLSKQDGSSSCIRNINSGEPKISVPVVKPFKKQLSYTRNSSDSDKDARSAPIHLRGINPLCDLSDLSDLEVIYNPCLPSKTAVMKKDLVLQTVRQELSELKDVHKKMYSFVMDEVIT